MSDKRHVFISMGARYLPTHDDFLDELMKFLRERGLEPRVIDKTDYPTGNPLVDISNVMKECDAAIIVAFERAYYPTGIEKRGGANEKVLRDVVYTTPWNQIEAAMAFILGLRMLVIAQSDLKEEGLIEGKFDWIVEKIDIKANSLNNENTKARISAWCTRVVVGESAKDKNGQKIDVDITVMSIIDRMTFRFAIQVGAMAVALFCIGFTIGGYFVK